jgi:hypothetical protein
MEAADIVASLSQAMCQRGKAPFQGLKMKAL